MLKFSSPQNLFCNLNTINQIVIAAFILLMFLTSACEKKTELKDTTPEEIQFTVNTTLLGNKINHDDLFEFFVPKMLTIQESDFTQLEEQLNSFLNDSIKVSFLYVFTDSLKENSLSVSRIILKEKIQDDPINYYSELIGNSELFKNASKAKFQKEGMLISQFIIKHNNHVIIKIIFEPKENYLIQFDYIFNEENYKQEVRSIESSMGSIKNL
jgi:hypothetical protein